MSKLKKIEKWTLENLPSYTDCQRIEANSEYRACNGITLIVDEDPVMTGLHSYIHENTPVHGESMFRQSLVDLLNYMRENDHGKWNGDIFNSNDFMR